MDDRDGEYIYFFVLFDYNNISIQFTKIILAKP